MLNRWGVLRLVEAVFELYKKVATELPEDVIVSLKGARDSEEKGSLANGILATILKNIDMANTEKAPMCQDTGTPIFHVSIPVGTDTRSIEREIAEATRKATNDIPLRPNAVDVVSGKNTGDGVGIGTPVIYFDEWDKNFISVELMSKGGGCENLGKTYSLPNDELKAARNLDGVRKCVLDAVLKSQGKGCPPQIVSVCIGGSRSAAVKASTLQLFRKLGEKNPNPELEKLEKRLLEESNSLGIGPLGLGGKTTVLGVKVTALHRHPASFFVDVSFSCWATRRASLEYRNGEVKWLK